MCNEKKWELRPAVNHQEVAQLAATLGTSHTMATILLQKGLSDKQSVEKFYNPSLKDLHDPMLMKGMRTAIERIERAKEKGERVMIYGDYDVDGTSSTALLLLYFGDFLKDMMYYIPDRYAEGYGISHKGIDYAAENGVTLIITVDCGIKAIEEVEYAKTRGVDFIITDHHLADPELPAAVAVVDPKQEGCEYPFKELSGCGVAFKIAQAFENRRGRNLQNIEKYLDLVATSIAADIVPLVDENRVLAYYGLQLLNSKDANKGLSAIIDICGLRRKSIQIEDIIFKIGPRINATGRMEIAIDPEDPKAQSGGRNAVKLMTAINSDVARKYVEIIEKFNIERKSADRDVTLQALHIIKEQEQNDPTTIDQNCTIIYQPEWMKGVMGIVASRLIENYYRPTVVLTKSNGMITGSARSVPGFDLYAAVEHCSYLLENFGGHMYAVGLTMREENFEEFQTRFRHYVDQNISKRKLEHTTIVDMEIELGDITPAFRSDLQRLAPFGAGNPSPVFVSRGVRDSGGIRKVGSNGEHLKLSLMQPHNPRTIVDAIGFSLSREFYPYIASGGSVTVIYTISENRYGKNPKTQLKIKCLESEKSL